MTKSSIVIKGKMEDYSTHCLEPKQVEYVKVNCDMLCIVIWQKRFSDVLSRT